MSTLPIDDLAALVDAHSQAVGEAKKWKEAAEVLQKRIQAVMGASEEATIGGRAVFTWKPAGKFNATRFGKDHPDLVVKYTRTVTRDELDVDALAADQPELFTAYRSRVFLRKSA